MLKTIEEAPQHIIFIFATTEMHKIPPTILSRSQHFLFNRLTHPELSGMLSTIAQQEHITIANEAIDKIISLADGSARDTLSILEQMSMYTNNQIKLNDVIDVFGLVDLDNKIKLINLILHRDTKAIMELLDNYDQNGINFSQLANDLIVILIDKLIFLQTNNFTILKNLTASTVELIKIDESTCIKLINVWQEAFMKMRNANDARFYFELAVFNSFKSEPGAISKPVVATNVPSPSTTTKPITPVPKTKELPPLDQVFTITPYQVNQPKVIPKSDKTKITKLDKNMLFYQIAYNNNKKCLQDAKHFLEKIKADNLTKVLSFITIADKVLVASCHGMVLLFEDEVDAELLNAKSNTYDFLNEIKKYFNNPIQVLGLTKEMGKQMANDFMKLKKQGNTFDEPDITTLKEIIKANNSVEQLAFELFGAK
jgi:DNA polymerase-3 subunit gamma/tau